jgi:uncharacterized protein YjiS (DUF1127 family)
MTTIDLPTPNVRRPKGSTDGSEALREGMLRSALQRIGHWIAGADERRTLATLDDYMLRDIGITREDANREASKPF